ncbi:MAG: DUF4268 domain-containing protein [Acidobacteria bacterium]|nr:DUF4268 domain-containing protein [Acidobacteriota bacterium]
MSPSPRPASQGVWVDSHGRICHLSHAPIHNIRLYLTRRHGQWWNYVVLQDESRAELYIDAPAAEDNKALFDTLHAERLAIEADFGGALSWQRLDDKRASRISFTVPGGWVDDQTWPSAIEQTVSAMQRLYRTLSPRVAAADGAST